MICTTCRSALTSAFQQSYNATFGDWPHHNSAETFVQSIDQLCPLCVSIWRDTELPKSAIYQAYETMVKDTAPDGISQGPALTKLYPYPIGDSKITLVHFDFSKRFLQHLRAIETRLGVGTGLSGASSWHMQPVQSKCDGPPISYRADY